MFRSRVNNFDHYRILRRAPIIAGGPLKREILEPVRRQPQHRVPVHMRSINPEKFAHERPLANADINANAVSTSIKGERPRVYPAGGA
jgi:hypothetical protein